MMTGWRVDYRGGIYGISRKKRRVAAGDLGDGIDQELFLFFIFHFYSLSFQTSIFRAVCYVLATIFVNRRYYISAISKNLAYICYHCPFFLCLYPCLFPLSERN